MIEIDSPGQDGPFLSNCRKAAHPYIERRHARCTRTASFEIIQAQVAMPEVIFPGPEGRLEGRFSPGPRPRAPVALILHPHPQGGGTMNNAIVLGLYKSFVRRGFATLRC